MNSQAKVIAQGSDEQKSFTLYLHADGSVSTACKAGQEVLLGRQAEAICALVANAVKRVQLEVDAYADKFRDELDALEDCMVSRRWIGVEDRLPEMGVPVLGWCEDEAFVVERWDPGDGGGWFWLLRDPMRTGITSLAVTHWMPLPGAPRGVP